MQSEKNIINLHVQQWQEWLKNLPTFVNQIANYWQLSNLQALPDLSYNHIVRCIQNEKPVILKICFSKKELQSEVNALNVFANHGCINLLAHNIELGALLLQDVIPGTSLKALFPNQDEQAVKIISHIIKKLQCAQVASSEKFQNISDWLKTLEKNWNIPQRYIETARGLSKQLLATTTKQVLLHGDLHHGNILLCEQKKWIAIDPKGVIGDPVYEVGASIRNPIPELLENNDAKNIIQNRINLFAKFLNIDDKRIFNWSYVQAVLSTCWAIEDGHSTEYCVKFLELLEEIQQQSHVFGNDK
jgi:streptomycin 6-kinase